MRDKGRGGGGGGGRERERMCESVCVCCVYECVCVCEGGLYVCVCVCVEGDNYELLLEPQKLTGFSVELPQSVTSSICQLLFFSCHIHPFSP